jgi:Zn-dependent protease with chaperone function
MYAAMLAIVASVGRDATASSGPARGPARAALRVAVLTQPGQERTKEPPSSTSSTESQKTETSGYKLSSERYAQAIAYSRAGYWLYFIGFAYGLVILWMILQFGIARRFRDWAEAASGIRFLQVAIFVGLLLIAIAVLKLPLRIYGHSLSLGYGQSVQGWGSWLWDWTKEKIIGEILGVVLAWILYRMIRRNPRRWWFYFWLATIPIGLLLVFSGPLIIDPLFHKFTPLQASHPELVAAIERVVRRGGMIIPPERMFLMQASEKSTEINAYVTGMGASKRVVVWDNTIRDTSLPETLFIFGHEMGHYVLHHIRKGFILSLIFLFILLFAGFHALHWTLGRRGRSWGIYGPEDLASLPVILLLLSITLFLCSPAINGYSRYEEHQADIYGLEVIHGIVPNSSEVAAHAFQVLGEVDLSDPHPPAFIAFWLYTHPPLADRLVFAHSYDPWSKGESPQFLK